ncbi:hypothetical protein ABT039_22895 [Streptomyces lasiicapitis]|uniref:hypothetical protein n=1 Tax=Streptomyces lasiicapitis TaxID=1923961 RepID=UPI00332F94D6
MDEVTNEDRAEYGRAALEHYEEARAALGREPAEHEDIELALAACAYGGSLDRTERVEAKDLREETEWAVEVLGDLVSNLFHAADGMVIPRLLLDAVADPEGREEADRSEAWQRLGERGPRFARFLAAVRRTLVTLHDADADGLFEGSRSAFEEEAEEERYAARAAQRA